MTEKKHIIKHAGTFFPLVGWFSSIDSLAEIVSAYRENPGLLAEPLHTSDFVVYEVQPSGDSDDSLEVYLIVGCDPVVGLENVNPIIADSKGVRSELKDTGNYRVTKEQRARIQKAIQERKAIRIPYAALDNPGGCRLVQKNDIMSALEINAHNLVDFATDTSYFNDVQRALLAQLHGRPEVMGGILVNNMKQGLSVEVLSLAYILEHAADVPIFRGCHASAIAPHVTPWVELHEDYQFNTGQARGLNLLGGNPLSLTHLRTSSSPRTQYLKKPVGPNERLEDDS